MVGEPAVPSLQRAVHHHVVMHVEQVAVPTLSTVPGHMGMGGGERGGVQCRPSARYLDT